VANRTAPIVCGIYYSIVAINSSQFGAMREYKAFQEENCDEGRQKDHGYNGTRFPGCPQRSWSPRSRGSHSAPRAETYSRHQCAVPARQSLLDFTLGAKQVIGYFNNEKGQCKVTIMVADAFDDARVADTPAVRFEVALEAGAKALMDTAAGRSLEFTCGEGAREMTVEAKGTAPVYASRT
jgi:hypothetical protein